MRLPRWERPLAMAALSVLTGCFLARLLPDTRTPAERAREEVLRCEGFSEYAAASILSSSSVDTVEPAYVFISSGSAGREARLRGAKLHLRPAPTLTRESLQRSLECHQARVVLGDAVARDEDPYFLPGGWVDIEASSEGDGFVVAVQADRLSNAEGILARARRLSVAASSVGPGGVSDVEGGSRSR